MRLSKDEYFLEMLKLIATRSTCVRRAVGAIITDKDGHVLSTGYNGVPRNFPHCIDIHCAGSFDKAGDTSSCLAIHAEQNALLQCGDISRAFTIYCSCVPCFICSKLISNTNIQRVVVQENYADQKGRDVFLQAEIELFIHGEISG